MPKRIVYNLKVVEVKEKNRYNCPLAPLSPGYDLVKPIHKEHPIWQSGEVVVVCHLAYYALHTHPLGYLILKGDICLFQVCGALLYPIFKFTVGLPEPYLSIHSFGLHDLQGTKHPVDLVSKQRKLIHSLCGNTHRKLTGAAYLNKVGAE